MHHVWRQRQFRPLSQEYFECERCSLHDKKSQWADEKILHEIAVDLWHQTSHDFVVHICRPLFQIEVTTAFDHMNCCNQCTINDTVVYTLLFARGHVLQFSFKGCPSAPNIAVYLAVHTVETVRKQEH